MSGALAFPLTVAALQARIADPARLRADRPAPREDAERAARAGGGGRRGAAARRSAGDLGGVGSSDRLERDGELVAQQAVAARAARRFAARGRRGAARLSGARRRGAALVPRAEIEGEMGEMQVGLQARLMSQSLRKLTGSISRSRCRK